MQMNFTSFSLLTSTPCHSVLYPNALMIQKNIKQLLLDNTKDNSLKTGYINNISLLSETKCQSTFYLGNLKVMVKFRTHLRMTDNYPKSAHSAKIIQTNISKVEHDLSNLFTRLMIYVVAFLCIKIVILLNSFHCPILGVKRSLLGHPRAFDTSFVCSVG